jgi:hypothetical protein
MTCGGLATGTLATVASTSNATASDWHQAWFLILFVGSVGVVFGSLYIIFAGAIPWLPPRSWSVERRAQIKDPRSQWMESELTTGYQHYGKARMANPGSQDFIDACVAFRNWGQMVNGWIVEQAPIYHENLTQSLPLAIFGKAAVLEGMRSRLRTHAEVTKQLDLENRL